MTAARVRYAAAAMAQDAPIGRSPVWSAAALLLALAAAVARAQEPPAPTLAHLALGWVLGDWVEPIVCEIHGSPTRALRRVMITPVPTFGSAPPTVRVQFPDPDAPGATRCFSDLGGDEPRIEGALVLAFEGRARPDTAQHDFETTLRRSGGFDFPVRSGHLRLGGWGEAAPPLREVEFEGGQAQARDVRPGSDAARLVEELHGVRGLELALDAKGGERVVLHLVQRAGR